MVRGIKFVSIPVRDQDVALNFTPIRWDSRSLLTTIQFDPEDGSSSLSPAPRLDLHSSRQRVMKKSYRSISVISFWCDDVFATAKVLKTKGVTFTQEPKNEVWGSVAVFQDPDGNQFALSSKGKQK